MPLIDDPLVGQVLLPHGFNTLPGAETTAKPELPAEPKAPEAAPWVPSVAEKAIIAATALADPTSLPSAIYASKPEVQAAFRSDNTIGSAIAKAQDTYGISNDLIDPNYNPWEDIKGTKYEGYWDTFIRSNNPAFTAALKASIDRQEEDRKTVAAAGWGGTVAGMIAGTVDPSLLIPGGGEIALGKEGWTLARGALAGARAAAVGVTAQELGLQASQDIRTGRESMQNIAGGIVLGAVLGGSAASLLSAAERVTAERGLEHLETVQAGDAGAAATRNPTIEDMTVAGKATRAVADVTAFSPNLRGNTRLSPLARQTYQEIADNPLYQAMHDEGRTLGADVSTQMDVSFAETYQQGVVEHQKLWRAAKKEGVGMSAPQFDEAVGRAMRREDLGENDFVSNAARAWRTKVIEPLTKQAIDLGMLPEDVGVTEAASYFSRQYNKDMLVARRDDFMSITTAYLNGLMQTGYAKAAEKLQGRVARLEQERLDLQLTPEERVAAQEGLVAQRAALDEAMPEHAQLVTKLNAARSKVRKAKTAEEKAAAEAEVADLKAQGGEGLTKYNKEVSNIAQRNRAINFNIPGLAEKSAKIEESIQGIAETNQRMLQRLVERGKKMSQELKKFDEVKLQKTISDLRTQFHQMIEASNAAQDRLAASLEKLKDLPEAKRAKLQAAAKVEADRMERLNKLDDRMQAAEALDYKASVEEIKATIDELVKEMSAKTLTRGERIAAWKQKMLELDPKKIEERLKTVEQLKKDHERAFLDRWEVKRLGEGVGEKEKPDFTAHAKDLAAEIHNRLVGNDFGSGIVDPEYKLPISRGPLKDRTFHIPDKDIEMFLKSNAPEVMEKFSRQMGAQIELTKKFGDINLKDRLPEIEKQYDTLATAAKTEKERLAIQKDREGAIEDLHALRDMKLGSYLAKENASNWGRVSRGLMNVNYIRSMGGAAIPSLSDILGPAMFHSWGRYFQGWGTLLGKTEATAALKREAKYAVIADALSHHRLMTVAEIGDQYAKGNTVERFLTAMTRAASKWNGLSMLTDFEKNFNAIVVQDHLNDALVKGNDKRFLAWSGINEHMQDRMVKLFKQHGQEIDGVTVANTHNWDDADAVRAYRAAIAKSVNNDVVTRGAGDVPLSFLTPTGKLLTQFKTFNLAAHQRMMLRAMQMPKAQFLSGMLAITTMGMFAATLKALRGGEENWKKFQESAHNPGFLFGEGLDNSGLFTLPLMVGDMTERATGEAGYRFNPAKMPLLLAGKAIVPDASLQGNSQRFAGGNVMDAIAGPTAGLIHDTLKGGGGLVDKARGKEMSMSQKRAATRLVPFSSYLGIRDLLQLGIDDSPYVH